MKVLISKPYHDYLEIRDEFGLSSWKIFYVPDFHKTEYGKVRELIVGFKDETLLLIGDFTIAEYIHLPAGNTVYIAEKYEWR